MGVLDPMGKIALRHEPTPPIERRAKGRFAPFGPPLMSNSALRPTFITASEPDGQCSRHCRRLSYGAWLSSTLAHGSATSA